MIKFFTLQSYNNPYSFEESRSFMKKEFTWRWLFFVAGITIMALGISLTIKGQRFGLGPWDVLNVGLHELIGLSIGTWAILTGILIVIFTMMGTRKFPPLGTWLNIFFIGSFIDVFNWIIPDVTSFVMQLIFFLLGVVIMGIGVGVYVSPNVGAGPRDSLMLLIMHKTGWSVKKVRTGIEVIVGFVGWLLGGPIGVGTIIIALLLGQLIHYTLPMSRRYLHKLSGYTLPETNRSAEDQK